MAGFLVNGSSAAVELEKKESEPATSLSGNSKIDWVLI